MGMHEMHTMGMAGHTTVRWDPDDKKEIETAKAMFTEMTGKGYAAFSTDGDGGKGERIREFDPSAEEIILVPPIRGG